MGSLSSKWVAAVLNTTVWRVLQTSLFYVNISCVGNTRVIKQSELQRFQDELGKAMKDPYSVC